MDYLNNIQKEEYLKIARLFGNNAGYDSESIFLSDDKKHKLYIIQFNKKIYFGARNSNDYIIYLLSNNIPYAKIRRKYYLIRSKNILGNWKYDDYSKNNLSRRIIWDAID